MTNGAPAGEGDLSYVFKTSVLGSGWGFSLAPDGLVWAKGRHAGRLPFSEITRVRMTYRPVTMQTHRFVTEIWSRGTPKLSIASTSWKNMLEQQRLDGAYTAFIRGLHERIAGAGKAVTFQGGLPAPIYWAGLLAFAVVSLGLVGLIARSALAGAWGGAAIVALFLALFICNGRFFVRNKPVHYRPDALPPQLLPCV